MIFPKYCKFYIFTFLLLIVGLYSCKKEAHSDIKLELTKKASAFMNRSILFASLFLDSRNSVDTVLWHKRNKIILYIDSLDCTTCTFNEIRKWNIYHEKLKKLNTDIVIICNYPNDKDVLDIRRIAHVNYPIFFDTNKQFKLINNMPQEAMFNTFVVGNNNQVIWIGLPIRSKKSWEDFCLMMRLYNENK